MNEQITLTRQELYDKVWTKSIVKLAEEFGLSDRGLAKICQRYDIPRPGLGYWAKLEYGKKVEKKPLPSNPQFDKEPIIINPIADDILCQHEKKRTIQVKSFIPILTNLNDIKELHPAVIPLTKINFEKSFRKESLVDARKTCFDISVGPTNTRRVILLIDAIIKAVERRGHKFSIETEKREYGSERYEFKHCCFEIKSEKVRFSIREKLNQVEHVLTSEEKNHKKMYGNTWGPKHDFNPSGKLKFIIAKNHFDNYTWIDTEKKKLEDKLPSILKGILKAADYFKKQRFEEKIRAIRQAQERQRAWEEERRRMEEQKCIENLMAQVNNWQTSRRIRQFLRRVERIAIRYNDDRDSKLNRWIDWAYRYADKIDPLIST
jgi:hypothetical protein